MKSKITFLLIAALSILVSIGFFNGLLFLNFAALLTLLLSISYLLYISISYFTGEKTSFYDELGLGLLLIITVKAAFLGVAGNLLGIYPIDILLLIIFACFQPFLNIVLYVSFVSIVDIIPDILQPSHFSLQTAFTVGMMLLTTVAVNLLSAKGRKARKKMEGMIKGMQTSARVLNQSGSEDVAIPAVSRDEAERVSSNSIHKAAESVTNTLRMLKKVLGCHNCILFEAGKKTLTVIAAALPDKDISYEIPNESVESFLGWIAEHKVPLRIADVRDRKGIGYYAKDEGINSFIGVPVFGEKDELKGILCADSKEREAFTSESERLLLLSAHGISEFLKNISILRRMKTETNEFTVFYNLSKKLGSTLHLDEILDIALHSSKEIVDYDFAAFILKEGSEELRVASAKGLKAAEALNKIFKSEESVAGLAMKNAKPLNFSDFQEGKRDVQIFPGIFLPIRSLICLPLLVKDDIIGAFIMASKRENFFSQYEARIFEVIASHTAIAISNARVYLQMEKMAATDGLTGLFNHRYFQDKLSHEIERADRYKEKVSLLLVDIDHFKKVNDTCGHPAGDKILKNVAGILSSAIRTVDVAARYGGEEFAVILVNTDGKGALETAERIRKIIENGAFDIGGGSIRITGSIGIAVFPDDMTPANYDSGQRLLISKADSALYLAKREGRNRTYLFKDVSERIEDAHEV